MNVLAVESGFLHIFTVFFPVTLSLFFLYSSSHFTVYTLEVIYCRPLNTTKESKRTVEKVRCVLKTRRVKNSPAYDSSPDRTPLQGVAGQRHGGDACVLSDCR